MQFTEEQIAVAIRKLNSHHRLMAIHYDDTVFEIELATGLSEEDTLKLIQSEEVESEIDY